MTAPSSGISHDGLEEEIIADMIFGMQKAVSPLSPPSSQTSQFAVEQINQATRGKAQLEASDFSQVLVWNGNRRPDQVLRYKTFSPRIFGEIRDRFMVTPADIIVRILLHFTPVPFYHLHTPSQHLPLPPLTPN